MDASRKTLIKEIGKAFIEVALIGFLLSRIEFGQFAGAIRNMKPGYGLWSLALFGVCRLTEGMRLHILIRRYGFSAADSQRIMFIGVFFSNLSSTVIGDGYKVLLFRERIKDWGTPVAVVLVERMSGFLVTVVIGTAYLAFNYPRVGHVFERAGGQLLLGSRWGWIAAVVLVVAGGVILKWGWRRLLAAAIRFLSDIRNFLGQFTFADIGAVVLLTLITHGLVAAHIVMLVEAFHDSVAFVDSLFVIFVLFIATYIPITIGSLGVREGVLVLGLALFGVAQTDGTAVAIVARIIIYVYSMVGGVLFVLHRRRSTA